MFKTQNLLYLLIWTFNIFTFILAKRIDNVYLDNKGIFWKYKDLFSWILKIIPLLMMFSSIVLTVISTFLTNEITNSIISTYFIITFVDLIFTGIISTIYERH